MEKTAKLTVTLPRDMISLADRVAKERKTSRSKVISACLQDLADKRLAAEMAEGYLSMAKEQKRLAAMVARVAPEILPDWK